MKLIHKVGERFRPASDVSGLRRLEYPAPVSSSLLEPSAKPLPRVFDCLLLQAYGVQTRDHAVDFNTVSYSCYEASPPLGPRKHK